MTKDEQGPPLMPNVMKVYLENGQTKSFKYDSATTVADVLNSLQQKLGFKSMDHFSLCVEHVKSIRKNKLTLLDPAESLAWVSPLSRLQFHAPGFRSNNRIYLLIPSADCRSAGSAQLAMHAADSVRS